jgi:hypothetical protein
MLFDPHTAVINRVTGEPLMEERMVLTHGIVVARALDAKYEDERNLAAEKGMKRFMLATRILGAPPGELVELKDGEPSLIKELTAKGFPPGIYGQIHLAIDAVLDRVSAAAKANGAHQQATQLQ